MKILLWSTYSLPYIGGIETLVHTLALQLKAKGHEVRVLASNRDNDDCQYLERDGIPIYLFPFLRALTALQLPFVKKILNETSQFLEEFLPDVVNIHGWNELPAFYQARSLAKRNIPILLTVHGLLEQDTYQTPSCLQLMRMTKALSFVSQGLLKQYRTFDIESPLPQLIYNSVISPNTPTLPVDTENQRLVIIGRLTMEKGFEIAIEAVNNLAPHYPRLRLTIVGGGLLMNDLIQLRQKYHLEHIITFTDFVSHEEIFHHIDTATFVLMPSSYESFGLVALETAMRERAIIASNVMGLQEIVDHDKTGILIEPIDANTLQQAIENLLQNPEKIRKMSLAAKEKSKRFSVENMTNQYEKIYNEISAKREKKVI